MWDERTSAVGSVEFDLCHFAVDIGEVNDEMGCLVLLMNECMKRGDMCRYMNDLESSTYKRRNGLTYRPRS